jgi:hypothetical protein
MAGVTIHRKKSGGAYAYSFESYWDKEKKAPRTRQVCLGRINEETGEITPSKRRARKQGPAGHGAAASAKVCGPCLLLEKAASDIGLAADLRKSFPGRHGDILSLAFFAAQKGLPLSRCEAWSESHCHPSGHPIGSQRASELLKQVAEDGRQHFFSLWAKRMAEGELLCYDITSISSYAKGNEYVRRGYNRDNESLPQINLAVLYGQKSGLPAYYRRLPGNISDTKTLQTTMEALDFIGKTKLCFVLDRGFYSEKNAGALLERRCRFVMAVPSGRLWARDIIDQHCDKIMSPERYRQTGEDEALYMAPHLLKWGGRRVYAHLYYSAARAADDFDSLTRKLIACKKELESDAPQEKNAELYERFFIIKKTPKRGLSAAYNEPEIQKYRKRYAGFFCILTNMKMGSEEVLEIYRRKEVVENCFDDLKNGLDMKRLRVHSSEAMDGRLFVQFLALALISRVRMVAKNCEGLKYMSVREIMEAMESVVRITYSGRYGSLVTETGPVQKKIIEAFGLELKT